MGAKRSKHRPPTTAMGNSCNTGSKDAEAVAAALRLSSGELRMQAHGVIDLEDRDLKTFPDLTPAGARLEYTETLNLSSNQLTSLTERDMQVLPNLTTLLLRNNKLSTIPSLHFLQFLEVLDLKKNLLREVPASIASIPSLSSLDLSGNQLVTLPAELGQCRSLRTLNVSDNDLHALPVELGFLHLAKGGFDWSLNPKLNFPPREIREVGQQRIMEWLQKQADIEHPVVREKKQALEKIRKRETGVWLGGMKDCGWNTQEEYEEQLVRKPAWMSMDDAMQQIAAARMGGGWWPDDDYEPPCPHIMQSQSAPTVPLSAGGAATVSDAVVDVDVAEVVAAVVPEKAECTICMAAPVGVVFLPCGHAITCKTCAAAIAEKKECPACRGQIEQVMNLFWAS